MSTTPDEIKQEVDEKFRDSTMSGLGKRVMVSNEERKMLRQELEEAQKLAEELSPATPTGTIDSYVKWGATILSVLGVFLISAGSSTMGQCSYAVAAIAWVYVGHCWNDKAIMIGSAITGTAVLMNLVEMLS